MQAELARTDILAVFAGNEWRERPPCKGPVHRCRAGFPVPTGASAWMAGPVMSSSA